jgi:RHS repeat-associated protein
VSGADISAELGQRCVHRQEGPERGDRPCLAFDFETAPRAVPAGFTSGAGCSRCKNTTSRPGDTGAQSLAWSDEGKLAQLTEDEVSTDYLYDASGTLLIRTAENGERVLYAGATELHLRADGTTWAQRYYSASGITAAVRSNQSGTDKVTYLTGDHHGTSSLALNPDTNQTFTKRYATPFGQDRGKAVSGFWPDDKGFLGKTRDASTGLTHIGAREYDPAIGQFISIDPVLQIEAPQTLNGYSYAAQNPVTFWDPTGTEIGSRPNSCEYSLEYCDKATQDAVGYDRNTGKTDYTKGTAVGDGSIVPINNGKSVKEKERLKLDSKVADWLEKDLGYRGSVYLGGGEAQAWIDGMANDKKMKELQEAAASFYGCYVGRAKGSTGCMKDVQKTYKKQLGKESGWDKALGILKKAAGPVAGVVLGLGCTFITASTAAAGCVVLAAMASGAIDYALSDEENKTYAGFAEAAATQGVLTMISFGANRWVAPLAARYASNRDLWSIVPRE